MKKLLLLVVVIVGGGLIYHATTKSGTDTAMENDRMMTADPRVSSAQEMLTGRWSSEDDRNFERAYMADGSVTDFYASASGETETKGTYWLFTADNAPTDLIFQLNNTDVYVQQTDDTGVITYSRVVSVTPTELELMNMDKGSAMRFGKINGEAMRDGVEE